jgi:hypothetical protein
MVPASTETTNGYNCNQPYFLFEEGLLLSSFEVIRKKVVFKFKEETPHLPLMVS